MKKIVMFLLLILYSGVAFSVSVIGTAFRDGNDILSHCEKDSGYSRGICNGYITGVVDASRGIAWDGTRFCEPDIYSDSQLKKIVIKYLNDHPEKLHKAAGSLVQAALYEAFPCE